MLNVRMMIKRDFPYWVDRKRFEWHCRGILKTSPVECRDDGCAVVSLLSHRDLLMYLVSMKSFERYFSRGRFVVINDGSLTDGDIRLLRRHCRGIEIVSIADVPNTRCPKGGCWERLLCASDFNRENDVIVLDADMLTQGPVPEVDACLKEGRPFILGLRPGQKSEGMQDVWKRESGRRGRLGMDSPGGIQSVFETNLDRVTDFERRHFIQGSGGFHRFPRGAVSRESVEGLSAEMETVFGSRWKEWGTEQITACLLVARSEAACVLPYPQYAIYYGGRGVDYEKSAMLHFIGTHRFQNKFYEKAALRVIGVLTSGR